MRPEIWNPYPYLRIFPSKKKPADFTFFFFSEIFAHQDPFVRLFLPKKWLILQFFRNFFRNWTPFYRSFWPKWDPCLRIFGEKVTHLDNTSLYALTCELPPPPPVTMTVRQYSQESKEMKTWFLMKPISFPNLVGSSFACIYNRLFFIRTGSVPCDREGALRGSWSRPPARQHFSCYFRGW